MTDARGPLTVAVFDADPETRNHYIAVALARAIGRDPRVGRVLRPGYDTLVDTCRGGVDVLVALASSVAFATPLARAAALAGTAVLWTGEDPYELPSNRELAGAFDLVFTNDAGSVAAYGPGAAHLPFAASLDFHDTGPRKGDPAGTDDSLFDLLFVGTAWPNRIALLDALVARLRPGLRLKFGLSGNTHLSDWQLGSPGLLTDFRVSPRDFARMARRSRLVLTLDRDFSSAEGGRAAGTSPPPRLFEVGLVGTPQIYLSGGPLDPAYYQDGDEVAVCPTLDRAAAEIERLLADEDARRRMGERAAERTRREHLYEHRAATILDAVPARRPNAKPSPRVSRPGLGRRKPRVLAVAHNLAGVPPFGGVELYGETLAAALPEIEFVSFAASDSRIALTLVDPARRVLEASPAAFMADGAAFDPHRERVFGEALVRHGIDLVHYQHLMHHSLAYPAIGAMLGVPQVATVHDYFLACSRFNLIGHESRFCGIDTDDTALCDICLKVAQDVPDGSQARRREIVRSALGRLDSLLFNTPASLDLMRRIYPGLDAARCAIVGMTGAPDTLAALRRGSVRAPDVRSGPLAVAVLGNLSLPKGAAHLVPMMWQLRHEPIVFHLHGRVDDDFAEAVAALPNVVMHGPYAGAELSTRLAGQHVSLHFSIWPETYCITLDEARAAGLVPIVLGYGALAERVVDGRDGYVVPPERPYDLVPLLRRLAADLGELAGMAGHPIDPAAAHDRHVAAVRQIYERLLADKAVPATPDLPRFRRAASYREIGPRFGSAEWASPAVEYDPQALPDDLVLAAAEARLAAMPATITERPGIDPPGDPRLAGGTLRVDALVFGIGSGRTARLADLPDAVVAFGGSVDATRAVQAFGFDGPVFGCVPVAAEDLLEDGRGLASARLSLGDLPPGRYDIAVAFAADGGLAWIGTGIALMVGTASAVSSTTPIADVAAPPQAVPSAASPKRRGGRLGALWRNRDEEARGHLDVFAGPHDAGSMRRIARSDVMPLRVGGWLVPRDGGAPFRSIAVRLVGRRWTARIDTIMTDRQDVADLIGAPHLLRNGFVSLVELAPLPAGPYRIELVGTRADGREAVLRAGTITLA